MEAGLKDNNKYLDALGDGGKLKMRKLIANPSEVIGPIEKVAWGDNPGVFGARVCFTNTSKMFVCVKLKF